MVPVETPKKKQCMSKQISCSDNSFVPETETRSALTVSKWEKKFEGGIVRQEEIHKMQRGKLFNFYALRARDSTPNLQGQKFRPYNRLYKMTVMISEGKVYTAKMVSLESF